MPFSGHILEEVLARRLQEEVRLQQERKQAEELALRRQEMQQIQEERLADRKYRQDMLDRADAAALDVETPQGPISEEAAMVLGKSPITAPRVQRRQVIDASPIRAQSVLPGAVEPQPAGEVAGTPLPPEITDAMAGWPRDTGPAQPRLIEGLTRRPTTPTQVGGEVTASTDTSGPQNYPVRMPTRAEAEKQKRIIDLRQLGIDLQRDPDADARIRRAMANPDLAKDIPSYAVEQTPGERARADRLKAAEAEKREQETWKMRNKVEFGQQLALQDARLRAEADRAAATERAKALAAKGDPEAKKMLRNWARCGDQVAPRAGPEGLHRLEGCGICVRGVGRANGRHGGGDGEAVLRLDDLAIGGGEPAALERPDVGQGHPVH
jgi:hypothetical protein